MTKVLIVREITSPDTPTMHTFCQPTQLSSILIELHHYMSCSPKLSRVNTCSNSLHGNALALFEIYTSIHLTSSAITFTSPKPHLYSWSSDQSWRARTLINLNPPRTMEMAEDWNLLVCLCGPQQVNSKNLFPIDWEKIEKQYLYTHFFLLPNMKVSLKFVVCTRQ